MIYHNHAYSIWDRSVPGSPQRRIEIRDEGLTPKGMDLFNIFKTLRREDYRALLGVSPGTTIETTIAYYKSIKGTEVIL